MRLVLPLLLLACASTDADPVDTDTDPDGAAPELVVTEDDFRCITDMTPVRGFYVDNLLGDLDATLAVAKNLRGNRFPVGSVVQLVPQEAMVKREPGFNTLTHDWEFFFLQVNADGTTIQTRGATETENVFGGNCFACHAPAAEFDLICEQDNGCDSLPIGPDQFEALQANDPRCR